MTSKTFEIVESLIQHLDDLWSESEANEAMEWLATRLILGRAKFLKDAKVSEKQLALLNHLLHLEEQDEPPMRMGDVNKLFHQSSANSTVTMKRLEKLEYTKRNKTHSHGNIVHVQLTRAGRRLAKRSRKVLRRTLDELQEMTTH